MSNLNRITHDSSVAAGPPTIRDTGVTVAAVLDLLASGSGTAEIRARHPALEPDDVEAALEFLAVVVSGPEGAAGSPFRLGMPRSDFVRLITSPHVHIRISHLPGPRRVWSNPRTD